jgi:hypothetical protein
MPIQTKRLKIRRVITLLTLGVLAGYASFACAGFLPAPPRIPRDFRWKGRYLVPDLGVDVPFSWQGKDGNLQMAAGGDADPIHFTNLIYDNKLYTLTYKWLDTIPPGSEECVCLGGLTLETLNACLNTSRYVGAEVLLDRNVRLANHFRVSVVFGNSKPKPRRIRVPIMEGDFYLDPRNSTKFWKVLHFGFQNLLDPALDEWIVLQDFRYTAGEVTLPNICSPAMCPDNDVFGPGFFCK